MKLSHKLLPFMRWLPLQRQTLRADAIAGATVAMVLIPQSMAYAQLAGMPAYYIALKSTNTLGKLGNLFNCYIR